MLTIKCRNCDSLVRLPNKRSYVVCSTCGQRNKFLNEEQLKKLEFKNLKAISSFSYCACPDHELATEYACHGPRKFIQGHNNKGKKLSEETKKKISLKNKNNKGFLDHHHSEQAKKKLSIFHTGKVLSEETKEKISQTLKLKKFTPPRKYWFKKGRISQFKGKKRNPWTEEHRRKYIATITARQQKEKEQKQKQ